MLIQVIQKCPSYHKVTTQEMEIYYRFSAFDWWKLCQDANTMTREVECAELELVYQQLMHSYGENHL